MKVNIKKLNEYAKIPTYAKEGDAGLDFTAIGAEYNEVYDILTYHTGISLEIPKGYVGLIFPRSSIYKYDLSLSNCVGVIDSGYRGEIMFNFKRVDSKFNIYKIGDKIGQLIILPYPNIEFKEVDILSDSERGEGGFGSTN